MGLLLWAGCTPRPDTPASGDDTQLVVYSSHPDELLTFLLKEFRERSGLRVTSVKAGTGTLLDRLGAEAEHPVADVMLGGGVESLEAASDLFEAYHSPENPAIPPEFRATDGRWTGVSVLSVVLVYNTRLVAPGAEPRGWADLTLPRFFGAIAYADPRSSGSAYSQLRAFEVLPGSNPGLQTRFVQNLGSRPFLESTKVGPTVSSGEALVGLTFDTYSPWPDVAMVYPREGTLVLPDGVALVRNAAHPQAARRFIDFVLGADVGSVLVSRFHRRSVRSDAPDPEGLVPLSQVRKLSYDVQAAAREKASTLLRFTTLALPKP